jgi:type 1 fimbriae regulatory protein FimB/type 1 fimbriae regulatory protein FimE
MRLRASELADLRWDQVEFKTATLHIRRVKQGYASTHPILGDELRALPLRRLQREQLTPSAARPLAPQASPAWSNGQASRLGLALSAHMLRHACGYALANKGHDTRALQAYLIATSSIL